MTRLPRAALLGSIGGAGIALIGLLPLLKVFADPIVGFVGLGVILVTLFGRARLPGGLPGAFVSVVAAVAVSWVRKRMSQPDSPASIIRPAWLPLFPTIRSVRRHCRR